MKKIQRIIGFFSVFLGYATRAFAGHNIGSSTGTLYSKVTTAAQDAVNFVDGPLATACVVFALIGALVAWNFAPQQSQWVGRSVRAVVSGILVFAITIIVNYLKNI